MPRHLTQVQDSPTPRQDWLAARWDGLMHLAYGRRKQALFGELRGRVLELGAGTGVNRRYLNPEAEWIALEPDPRLRPFLLRQNPLGGLLQSRAEALPLADLSVDAVFCSLVLCSVTDPAQVLREVLRVLRPGGCLAFVEHVAAPKRTWLRWLQDRVQPAWTCLCGGCNPNRETWRTLEEAGFAGVDLEHFRLPLPVVAPQVAGRAWKAPRETLGLQHGRAQRWPAGGPGEGNHSGTTNPQV